MDAMSQRFNFKLLVKIRETDRRKKSRLFSTHFAVFPFRMERGRLAISPVLKTPLLHQLLIAHRIILSTVAETVMKL